MITINKAKIEDVFDIKKLLATTWTETYSKTYSPEALKLVMSDWHSPELLTRQIQDPDVIFITAKIENTLIAMCNTGRIIDDTINIQRLHVLPNFQRQGLGSMLLDEVIRLSPQSHKAQLEVEKQNLKAILFYQKHGFKKIGSKIFKITTVRIPCFVMEKRI